MPKLITQSRAAAQLSHSSEMGSMSKLKTKDTLCGFESLQLQDFCYLVGKQGRHVHTLCLSENCDVSRNYTIVQ